MNSFIVARSRRRRFFPLRTSFCEHSQQPVHVLIQIKRTQFHHAAAALFFKCVWIIFKRLVPLSWGAHLHFKLVARSLD
jgi:hypothetical protein